MTTEMPVFDENDFDQFISEVDLTPLEEHMARVAARDAYRSQNVVKPKGERLVGIFDDSTDIFDRFRVEIKFTGKLMPGLPMRADTMEAFIRAKTGLTKGDAEVQAMAIAALERLGMEIKPGTPWEDIVEMSKRVAGDNMVNGFMRGPEGVYAETRCIKAMLKEVANILFPKEKWGPTGKGPRNAVAEWVFPVDDELLIRRANADGEYVPVVEPDAKHLFIGHVSGATGRRSTLTYYEFVEDAYLVFDLLVLKDRIKRDQWQKMFRFAQENGFGSLRSQGFGRCKVLSFEAVK